MDKHVVVKCWQDLINYHIAMYPLYISDKVNKFGRTVEQAECDWTASLEALMDEKFKALV